MRGRTAPAYARPARRGSRQRARRIPAATPGPPHRPVPRRPSARIRTRGTSSFAVPLETIAADQRSRRRRAPAAGGVELRGLVMLLPALADRIDPAPGRIQLVTAHEQRQVTL